jgi:tetratricopeptide (TPR) repeat protein
MACRRVAVVLYLLTLFEGICFAQSQEDLLWKNIRDGNFLSAVNSFSEKQYDNRYNKIISVLYSLLGDQKEFRIYRYRYNLRSRGEDILPYLRHIDSISPSANVRMLIGVLLWEDGNRAAAKEFLDQSLEIDPTNAYALNYTSMEFNKKDDRKYLELSLKALAIKGDYSEAYNNACAAYANSGDFVAAFDMLERSLARCEHPHPNTYSSLAYLVGQQPLRLSGSNKGNVSVGEDEEVVNRLYDSVRGREETFRGMINGFIELKRYDRAGDFLGRAERDHLEMPLKYFKANLAFQTEHYQDFVRYAKQSLQTERMDYLA